MAKRILVVEDQEENRQILRDLLANAGYHKGSERVVPGSLGVSARREGEEP
jgi:CheY-like chemotaxis protein